MNLNKNYILQDKSLSQQLSVEIKWEMHLINYLQIINFKGLKKTFDRTNYFSIFKDESLILSFSGIDFEGPTVGLAFIGTLCSDHSVGVVQVS